MNQWSTSESYPEELAALLAELDNRLRLSFDEMGPDPRPWPVFNRLGVQADLMLGVAQVASRLDLARFAQSLASLVQQGRSEPSRLPASLQDPLLKLAAFLDNLMLNVDSGSSLSEQLEDPGWELLILRFRHMDTPLLVMVELQEELTRWQNIWCDASLTSEQEKELKERWVALRAFADALFCPSSEESDSSLLRWEDFGPSP